MDPADSTTRVESLVEINPIVNPTGTTEPQPDRKVMDQTLTCLTMTMLAGHLEIKDPLAVAKNMAEARRNEDHTSRKMFVPWNSWPSMGQ